MPDQIEVALHQMHSKHIRVRAASGLAIGAMITLAAAAPAGAAGPGYGGGNGPPPVVTPVGFSSVLTARTVAKHGGSFSVKDAGGRVTVDVPKHATKHPIQIAITKGDNRTVQGDLPASLKGDKIISSFGVEMRNGSSATHTTKPVTITLRAHVIKKGDIVLVYSPATGKFTKLTGAVVRDGKIVVHLTSGESIAVAQP
jgi:hypothetical protein